ncbi:hypothetical protein TNCV_2680731 [Trichonephila clavipes]|uniref:Uncharacterized protein n=1 Tax=Trichonephila clavipes TaxID=2585209 RepID=A0A8X6S4E4_TRICX|nr:hypothetical protein TNCV_2680731 [Trichonephila clavipes]
MTDSEARLGLLVKNLVILKHVRVKRVASEQVPHTPNFHTTANSTFSLNRFNKHLPYLQGRCSVDVEVRKENYLFSSVFSTPVA